MSISAVPGTRVRFRTHAKLNLFLRVLGRRPDGFHEIESVFHGIDLADEIAIEAQAASQIDVDMEIVDGPSVSIPTLEKNLAYAAASALAHKAVTGVRIDIKKRIPIGAGLGGGSGNAAGVLVALNEMWRSGLGPDDLNEVAASVGSDVAYCITGGTMLATARGEKLSSLPSPAGMWFVLGVSFEPLMTGDVYERWDDVGSKSHVGVAPLTLALGSGDPAEVGSLLHNDLEAPAFAIRPELEEAKKTMAGAGALGTAMTGSGPTIYGLARDAEHAREIAARVEGRFDAVLVTSSASRCIEFLDEA